MLTILAGGPGFDVVYAGGGKDRIDRGSGIDTIYGGSGFDTINSTDLADRIVDTVGGYELLVAPPASSAHAAPVTTDDAVYAAASETVDIAVLDNDHDPNENRAVGSLTITMAPTWGTASVAGSFSGDVVVRYIAGTVDGVDSLAYQVCDTLRGADGDDTLWGNTQNDTVWGGHGDDNLWGNAGDDRLWGRSGLTTSAGLAPVVRLGGVAGEQADRRDGRLPRHPAGVRRSPTDRRWDRPRRPHRGHLRRPRSRGAADARP